jgi:hypothetical protein
MKSLQWWPETFRPTGNLTSEGARRQLGKSQHDPLTLLVRETMQNSWDAGLPAREIEYHLDAWHLNLEQREAMRRHVFPECHRDMSVRAAVSGEEVFVLAVSDRGTSGLTGPTRADHVRTRSEDSDFVDFVFNLGQPRDTEFGGGTYGYGKSILYVVSQVGTIVVYTRALVDGRRISRLIAIAMGNQYEGHTGRHWWGVRSDPDAVEPLIGNNADELAKAIGLPVFSEDETGTSLLIVAPDVGFSVFGDDDNPVLRSPEEFMAYLSAQYIWNFWPKMLDANEPGRRVTLGLSLDGRSLTPPDPNRHFAFYGLRQAAFKSWQARQDGEYRPESSNLMVRDIRCGNPRKDLGLLTITRFPSIPESLNLPNDPGDFTALNEFLIWNLAPFANRCSHIALMRSAELVVRYEKGDELANGHYAGLFVVNHDAEIDQAFAASEPPAHDDWEPSGLPLPQKTFVKIGLRRIREAIRHFTGSISSGGEAIDGVPLGRVSEKLAGLVAAAPGTGPEVRPGVPVVTTGPPSVGETPDLPGNGQPEAVLGGGTTTSPGSGPGSGHEPGTRFQLPVVDILSSGELRVIDGQAVCCVRFSFPDGGDVPVRVRADIDVKINNIRTRETDPPEGAELPGVVGWIGADGNENPASQEILIEAPSSDPWEVRVSVPRDTVFEVGLQVLAVTQQ